MILKSEHDILHTNETNNTPGYEFVFIFYIYIFVFYVYLNASQMLFI